MVVSRSHTSTFEKAIDTLISGGIVIMPCDTIYGICGVVPVSESRIRELKERDAEKPLIRLISDLPMLAKVGREPEDRRLLSYWPGPLTIVVPGLGDDTVAVRIPADDFVLRVVKRSGPIYSTSVNISGKPHLNRTSEIVEQFEDRVDLIVDGGDFSDRLASTVVDSTASPNRLIRQGACRLPESLFSQEGGRLS